MTKLYKCPRCAALGYDIIYEIFMTSKDDIFRDSRTGEVIRIISGPPDVYDIEYPVWTRCSVCKNDLMGPASQYIIEVDEWL